MKKEWKRCILIGVTAFCVYLAVHYWTAFVEMITLLIGAAEPLLIGCVTAYLLNILMSVYERYYFPGSRKPAVVKSRRIVCMLASFLTLIGIVLLMIQLVIPELISCIQLLTAEIPQVLRELLAAVQQNEVLASIVSEEWEAAANSLNWKEIFSNGLRVLSVGVGGVMESVLATFSTVFSVLVTGIIGGIFAIYLLIGKEKLAGQCGRLMEAYLPSEWNKKVISVLEILNSSFRSFIIGQCVEAVVLGVLCTIGMLILQFPYAAMIGALVGFTALIPVAGAYIGAGVGAFMILTVSPVKAAGFLVYIVVLQQLEGNLIYPRVVGSSIGLPGLWVLAAVTVGGGLFGIGGMLIGVPLTAAIYQMIRMDVARREQRPDDPQKCPDTARWKRR